MSGVWIAALLGTGELTHCRFERDAIPPPPPPPSVPEALDEPSNTSGVPAEAPAPPLEDLESLWIARSIRAALPFAFGGMTDGSIGERS